MWSGKLNLSWWMVWYGIETYIPRQLHEQLVAHGCKAAVETMSEIIQRIKVQFKIYKYLLVI